MDIVPEVAFVKRLPRTVLIIGALILLLGLSVWGGLTAWQHWRSAASQSRVDTGQSGALRDSAVDALNTQASGVRYEEHIREIDRVHEKEILNAPGAKQEVDDGVYDAFVRSVCSRASAREDPACGVRQPDTGKLQDGR